MKRSHIDVTKAILKCINDGKSHAYGEIERKANTNWETVRNHVKFLEICEAVIIKDNRVEITLFGKKILGKIISHFT